MKRYSKNTPAKKSMETIAVPDMHDRDISRHASSWRKIDKKGDLVTKKNGQGLVRARVIRVLANPREKSTGRTKYPGRHVPLVKQTHSTNASSRLQSRTQTQLQKTSVILISNHFFCSHILGARKFQSMLPPSLRLPEPRLIGECSQGRGLLDFHQTRQAGSCPYPPLIVLQMQESGDASEG